MIDISLLYSGLSQYGIEQPPANIRLSNGFMRWGKNNRYYAREVENGYIFGDWISGDKGTVFLEQTKALTPEERRQREAKIKAAREAAEKEQAQQWKQKAGEALSLWQQAEKLPMNAEHPYLLKKRVFPYNLRKSDENLIIPLYDIDNKIMSLQFINNEGEKRFLSGGRVKGCFFQIAPQEKGEKIIVCEGYATGASIREATGLGVAVAFNKGNLEAVVKALKNKYPDKQIIIAADNDIKEDAPNYGLDEAQRVGSLFSCPVITPYLKSGGKCDFNDVATAEGLEQVKKLFSEQVAHSTAERDNKEEITQQASGLPLPSGFCLTDDSLLYIGGDGDPVKVSGHIEVIAKTRDNNSQNWGKLLQFEDPDGIKKEIAVPNTMFAGDCRELRELLLSEGLDITPAGKSKLSTYLMSCNPTARTLCINKTGWYNDAFVFPDSVIGKMIDKISFQAENFNNVYTTAGSLEQWRDKIGQYCSGNSRLVFAVSAAFAAALLKCSGLESGGFHFVGGSSCGKSTILRVAASVWGGKDYLRTWRATDNGLEGVASMHNDSLLILDELGQVDPGKAGEIAYMLGNGGGKTRATRNGTARNVLSWRLLYLSSGEKDLNDCATESKKKVKAGQEIRLLNIPAVPLERESYGAFEYLHGLETGGGFAEYLNQQVKEYYGTPARAFIQAITEESPDIIKTGIREDLTKIKEALIDVVVDSEADNQVGRAINRFALVAFAGEYATEKGLTGWEQGEASNAASWCLKDWLTARGGVGNQEDRQILEQVKYFFEQHAESRFYDLTKGSDQNIINMAGYKDNILNEWEYYVLPTVFNKNICEGLNASLVRDILTKKGWLKNKETVQKKIKGTNTRFYIMTSKLWG